MGSYAKGRREEQALVRLLRSFGLDAFRVPLSGQLERDKADIVIRLRDRELRVSVKYGSKFWKLLYSKGLFQARGIYVVPLRPLLTGAINLERLAEGGAIPEGLARELKRVDLVIGREKRAVFLVLGPKSALLALTKEARCTGAKT